MNIGENIKRIRKEKGITQKELGKRLGITQAAIGQFENNNSNLKMDTIKKIADALGVNYTRLIIETPFCSGSKEERSKMNDEELAEYLAYLITNNEKEKEEILSRVEQRKARQKLTIAAHFDGNEFSEEELDEIRQFAEFVKSKRKDNN